MYCAIDSTSNSDLDELRARGSIRHSQSNSAGGGARQSMYICKCKKTVERTTRIQGRGPDLVRGRPFGEGEQREFERRSTGPECPAPGLAHHPECPGPGLAHRPECPGPGLAHRPECPAPGLAHRPECPAPGLAHRPGAAATPHTRPCTVEHEARAQAPQ